MIIPPSLLGAIENEAAAISPKRLEQQAKNLSLRYRQQLETGARLLTEAEEAVAYGAARMPATYGAVYEALCQSLAAMPSQGLHSLFDVGAGTGAALWAAGELLDLQSAHCFEREEAMLETGKRLSRHGREALRTSLWEPFNLAKDSLPGKADLITCAYVLGEMTPAEQETALATLWQATGKMLLLLLPGTPQGHRCLLRARDILLAAGAKLGAPCPHEGPCPLPPEDWCHFTARVPRTRLQLRLKEGEAPYEDEKFAYMAFLREKGTPGAARVLRHPIIRSGFVTLRLCTPSGIEEPTVTRSDKARFKAARKANPGDTFQTK